MRNLLILVFGLLLASTTFSRVEMNEGPMTIGSSQQKPDESAILELVSEGKGFLPPRLTTAQRDAIVSPATGLLIFNSDEVAYQNYNGVAWDVIAGGGGLSEYESGQGYIVDEIVWSGTDFYKVLADHTATDVTTGIGNNNIIKMVDPNDYLVGLTSNIQDQLDAKVSKITSTDNSITRFDGTTGDVQDSLVTIDDTGFLNSPVDARINGVDIGLGAGGITSNTVLGMDALDANTSGVFNTAIGTNSLTTNTTGSLNLGLGPNSLQFNLSGSDNFGMGLNALRLNSTGARNIAIGNNSMRDGTNVDQNVAIGNNTLRAGNSSNSVAIGINAGIASTGTNNTIIGSFLDTNDSNSVLIGSNGVERIIMDGDGNAIFPDYGDSRTETNTISYRLGIDGGGQIVQSSNPTTTDNSIAKFDGVNGDVQNTSVTIDDSNNISTEGNLILGVGTGKEFDAIESFFRARNTGVVSPFSLTINADPTLFDISSFKGQIVDFDNDTYDQLDFAGATGLTPLNSTGISYIFLDKTGSIVQQSTLPSNQDIRNKILIGRVFAISGTISVAQESPVVAENGIASLYDLASSIGDFNASGNVFSGSQTAMELNKSAGELFSIGTNYATDRNKPHNVEIASCTTCTFAYITQASGSTQADTTTLDFANYDVGGVITSNNGANRTAQIQRIYLFPSGNIRIAYGQTIYSTVSEALQEVGRSAFTNNPNLGNGLLIGFIVARKNATDFSDPDRARVLLTSRFGDSANGSSGLGTSSLQDAYNNSPASDKTIDLELGGGIVINDTDSLAGLSGSLFKIATPWITPDALSVFWDRVEIGGILDLIGTGAIKLPVGTTAQRPSTPLNGMIRRNSDTNALEQYDGSNWITVGAGSDINYLGLNGDADFGLGQWTNFSDVQFEISVNTTTPLEGTADFLIKGKNFVLSQGAYAEVPFSIPRALLGREILLESFVEFDAGYNDGEIEFQILRDSDDEVIAELSLTGNESKIIFPFYADGTEVDYKLIIRKTIAGTVADVFIDKLEIKELNVAKSIGKTEWNAIIDSDNTFSLNEDNVFLSVSNASNLYKVYYNKSRFPSNPLVSAYVISPNDLGPISTRAKDFGSDGSGDFIEFRLYAGTSGQTLTSTQKLQITFKQKEQDQTAYRISTDLGNRNLLTEASGNSGQSITANVTNIPFDNASVDIGSWDGSVYTAQKDATYIVNPVVEVTTNVNTFLAVFIDKNDGNGFQRDKWISNNRAATVQPASFLVTLKRGWKLAIRAGASFTLNSGTSDFHKLVIKDIGNDSPILAPTAPQIAIFKDVKPANTAGGTATSGSYQTRVLNDHSGLKTFASLDTNQITINSKGRYIAEVTAPAYNCNKHRALLYDVTIGQNLQDVDGNDALGTSEFSENGSGINSTTRSKIFVMFDVDSPKTIELRHRVQTTISTTGFGIPVDFGDDEVYSTVKIQKIY